MNYRIYPSIGIARLGNSDELFIGPEVIGSRGRELDTGAEVTRFKDAQYRVRKQAARFHLFQQVDDDAPPKPAVLPPGAVVEWTVSLTNKKDAILRPGSPLGPLQPGQTLRPTPDPTRSDRLIAANGSIRSDEGPAASKPMHGHHAGHPVSLGELRVDSRGRLLVLGGALVSASHPPTLLKGRFLNNPNWHDDVSDGPVAARVIFPDGHTQTAEGAWALVAPPDFAPGAEPIVTLFDELVQVALDQGWASPWTQLSATPSFTNDIYPIIRRGRSLGWVHVDRVQLPTVTYHENWQKISQDFAQLSRNGRDTQPLRMETFCRLVRATSLLRSFVLPPWQTKYLNAWVNDQFSGDWNGVPPLVDEPTAQSLTRAALEGAVGQGFYPGIETGRIATDPSIYRLPFDFRITEGVLKPGDLTAFMAQPWQADFANCAGNWWPSHRPDLAPRPDGTFALWQRPVGPLDQASFLANVQRFGMITVKVDPNGVQISAAEEGRDPTL